MFFYKKRCEDLERILKLKGEISQVGLSVKSRKEKVQEIFDMPSDQFKEEEPSNLNDKFSHDMREETSAIARQIKEATRVSRQTDRRQYMSLPKIGKLKAQDLGDGSTTERNSDFSVAKPKRRYEATYDHNMDNYMNELTHGKLINASQNMKQLISPSRSTNKLFPKKKGEFAKLFQPPMEDD